jgi:hypothetical protein
MYNNERIGEEFMTEEEYIMYAKMILSTDSLSEDEKISYIQLIEKLRKSENVNLKELEKLSYTTKSRTLSDKEMINYELNRIYCFLENSDKYIDNIEKEKIENLLKKIAYANKRKVSEDAVKKMKLEITKLQLKYSLESDFYTVFESLVESLKDSENDISDDAKTTPQRRLVK